MVDDFSLCVYALYAQLKKLGGNIVGKFKYTFINLCHMLGSEAI